MKKLLPFIFVLFSMVGRAESDSNQLNLKRFFLDVSPTFAMSKPVGDKSIFS